MTMTYDFRRTALVLLALMSFLGLQAQTKYTVFGALEDSTTKEALMGANISLTHVRDSSLFFGTSSNETGQFMIKDIPGGNYFLRITYLGYTTISRRVLVDQALNLGRIQMREDSKTLTEAKVSEQKAPVVQKGDTSEYNADQYKTNPDANVGDLIKKMPGITVDGNGVQAQGEKVKKVLVDGQEFFGEDAQLALNNLPAAIVDKVQVYDNQNEQSRFTGFDDGNTEKTINIVTKAGRNVGQFGKIYAGYGTDQRYESGFNFNIFNGQQRISFIGMSNSINQQNFATDDLLGALAVGNQEGGYSGRRRRSMGLSTNPDDFMVGQQGGISTTHSLGLNYQNKWGSRLRMNGSYFLSSANNVIESQIAQNYFLDENANQLYAESQTNESVNLNHRLRFRVDFDIDSSNSIFYRPSLSVQGNIQHAEFSGLNTESNTILSSLTNLSNSVGTGFRLDQNLGWRHNFSKRGRTFSVMAGHELNRNYQDREQVSGSDYFDELGQLDSGVLFRQDAYVYRNNQKTDARLVYSEGLGKRGQLMIQYRPSYTINYSNNEVSVLDTGSGVFQLDSVLSGDMDNTVLGQSAGLNYRFGDRKMMFMVSMNYQYENQNVLQVFPNSNGFNRSYHNILPMAFFRLSFNRTDNLHVFYRSSNNLPNGSQLLEVLDNSNPLRLSIGNNDLDQELNHFIVARYNKTWSKSGRNLFAFANFNMTQDYIGNSSIVAVSETSYEGIQLARGTQLDRPVNLDQKYSFNSAITFGTPIKWLKSNLNTSVNYAYNETPGLVNEQLNTTRTNAINLSMVLSSNISEKVDFTLSYAVDINRSRNSLQPALNNNYLLHAGAGGLTVLPWKGLVLNTQVAYSNYTGLVDGFNQDFVLWNAAIGYKFLKDQRGDLRLKVFDILKQNNSIARSITETYVEDARTNVLQQYFLLTFTYTFRNFRSKSVD